jgi:multicomponent Na+:H+ antiporter subunit E
LCTGLESEDWVPGLLAALGFALLIRSRAIEDGSWVRIRFLPGFAAFFIGQSLATGLHVARLALTPRLRLRPGWIHLPSHLPPGAPRALFANLVTLLPGTLCGQLEENGVHHIHLLHTDRDPEGELRALERRIGRLFGLSPSKGLSS